MTPRGEVRPSSAFFVRRLLAYQPFLEGLTGLLWILYHSWFLIPGLLAKAFFDTLGGRGPAGLTPEGVVALVLAAGLGKAAVVIGAQLVGVPMRFRTQGLLQRNLLGRFLEMPGARALPCPVGEAISTLRDDTEMMSALPGWIFDVAAALIFAGGGLAILFWVNARVTLMVFAPIAVVIAAAQIARRALGRAREWSRESSAEVAGAIGEIFGAVLAVQAAGAEDRVVNHVRRLGDERRRLMLRDRSLGLSLDAVFADTANLGAGLTLLAAASAMRVGLFTVGDFALFATYLTQVMEVTGLLGWLLATYQQSAVSFARAVDLLQGAPPDSLVAHHPVHLEGPLPALIPAARQAEDRLESLEVAGLTCRHPGSGRGVEGVSFKLERDCLVVITGRVGSGKTTLLRAILGLTEAQAGEIRWNGRPVADPAAYLTPPRVAYTAQVPSLISGSLRENILLGLPDDQRLAQAVHAAVLEPDLAGFAAGLDTPVGANGVRLSGGQVQRVAAARMFARDPELFVFDDLSSALDIETETALWRRVLERGGTYLVVTHRRAVLERADEILVLDRGRVIARGTYRDLREVKVKT